MNDIQKHLLINHFPVILPLVGGVLLLVALVRREDTLRQAGLIVILASAMLTFVAVRTGEHAEEPVEELGFSGRAIHHHEETAETFAIFSYLSGGLAVATLFLLLKKHRAGRLAGILTLISLVPAFYFAAQTGHSGGVIRRPDLETSPGGGEQQKKEHEEEESGMQQQSVPGGTNGAIPASGRAGYIPQNFEWKGSRLQPGPEGC